MDKRRVNEVLVLVISTGIITFAYHTFIELMDTGKRPEAESDSLVNEEIVLYSQSLSKLRATQAGLDFKYEEGKAEGIAEGIAGEKRSIAQKMKKSGMDILLISNMTGLSSEQIMSL